MKRISINEGEYEQIQKDLEEFEKYEDMGEKPMVKALQLVGVLKTLTARAYDVEYQSNQPDNRFHRNGQDFRANRGFNRGDRG